MIFSEGGLWGLRWTLGLLCACLLLGLGVGPGVAFGVRGHEFGETIGWGVVDKAEKLEVCKTKCEPGLSGSGPGQFSTPVAVAVNEATGEFYVVDRAVGRVERFSLTGEYLGQFDASGTYEVVKEGHPEVITGPGAPTGAFLEPTGAVVDNSCLHKPAAERTPCEAEKGSPSFDPSYGDVYVADGSEPGHRVVDKFNPEGKYLGQLKVTECPRAAKGEECTGVLGGVAVDSSGEVWTSEDSGEFARGFGFDRFTDQEPNGFVEFVRNSGFPFRPGLAAGSGGVLYADLVYESPYEEVVGGFSEVSGAELGLVLREQERSTGVGVEIGSGDVYVDTFHREGASGFWSVGRFEPGSLEPSSFPLNPMERFGKGALVEGHGVGVDSRVADGGPVYVADAGAHDVVVFPLEEPKPPTVEETSVSAVTSGSAQLSAVVNPRGARTEYLAEIGVCGSVESCGSAPFEPVGGGEGALGGANDFEGHEVAVHPQDLQPGVTYHFRVLARNVKNAPSYTEGKEIVFMTELSAPLERLDGRGWELVSPADKHGALIEPIGEEGIIQAAAGGDAITYRAAAPTEEEPKGYDSSVQVLSRRTVTGWVSEDIDTSHTRSAGQSVGQGGDYRLFSEDLSVGLVQPLGAFEPLTSPEASEQTPYRHTDFFDGNPEVQCTVSCFQPLVTGENTEGVAFGEDELCPTPHVLCGPRIVGASPDGQQVVISSSFGLVAGKANQGGLFEWNEGHLRRVSVKPNGTAASPASEPIIGGGGVVARNAVSEDGSRVVWSETVSEGHIYLWSASSGRSRVLDKGLPEGERVFQAASADESRVFFTLDGELYVYEVEGEAGKVVRLTNPVHVGEHSDVLGLVPGVSRDGSIVYFVADGQLTGTEPAGSACLSGVASSAARCFLYMVQREGSGWAVPRVVAVLSGSDAPDFASSFNDLTVGVSPDGEWLAFMSDLSLTGYDNRDAVSGARDEEVFLFSDRTGRRVCVSCNPSGARPAGVEYAKIEHGLASGDRVWPGSSWLAANVPGWTPFATAESFYQSRFVLDDGRVFFNSADALVPQDVNGAVDVYEFEPVGVGSCTERSVTFGVRVGGCVGLVSSGTLAGESGFVDASASGSDVFFETANSLVPPDRDSAVDVYDARECGASGCLQSPPLPAGPCLSEASCKGEPSVQPEFFGAPASQLFSGLGNVATGGSVGVVKPTRKQLLEKALASCRKAHPRSRKQRFVCERRARARFASVAKRAVRSGKLGVVR